MRSDDDPTLAGFLQETALYTDLDTLDESQEYVSLMTVHTSKGLEFPVVFITGLENNLFPSIHALDEPLDMEEERRLMYVAITRAKKRLYLTYADERLLWGRTQYNSVSMFIKELPKANITGFGEKN